MKPSPHRPMTKLPFLCSVAILAAATPASAQLELHQTPETLEIVHDGTSVLTYHTAEVPPPEGVDAIFRRSGFLHPVRAPHGGVVTSIHAEDHYHHLGLWHAWVMTELRGRELDFWNLGKRDATVRFVGPVAITRGADEVGFTARQQQVALAKDGYPEEVVLEELLTVRVHDAADAHVIDYEIVQQNVTDAPLELPAYRYGGGIAYRAPQNWGGADAYQTSTGLDRSEGHATRADWCVMQGETEQGSANVAIMSHPSNHDSPQRMRIWPDGHVFFNYVPAQEHDWEIAPGDSITLRYRVVVRNGAFDRDITERDWAAYRASP